jgi:hypothetical protein
MEQRIGVCHAGDAVAQNPPPQKMGTQKHFSFVFGGELVVVKQALAQACAVCSPEPDQ